jgi:hypothetical protein
MESPNAVKVKKKKIAPANNVLKMTVAPLSAGVIKLKIGF